MTKDELKTWLRSYRAKKLEADHLASLIESMEAKMYHPKAVRLDRVGGASSSEGGGSPERLAIKHIEMVDKYREKLADLRAEQMLIETTIEQLEDETERDLMRLYYMEGLTWEEVAVAIHFGWRHTHRIHSRVLAKLSAE